MRITFVKKASDGRVTHIFGCDGEVIVQGKRDYYFRKEHPFIPTKEYRFIPYLEEKLQVKYYLNSAQTDRMRDLFNSINEDDELYLQWRTGSRVYTRKLNMTDIPEPTRLSMLHIMEFTVKYEPGGLPLSFDLSKLTRVTIPYSRTFFREEE